MPFRGSAPEDRVELPRPGAERRYSKLIGNMTDIWDYPLCGARSAAEVRELEDHRQGNTAYVLSITTSTTDGRTTHGRQR